MKPLRVGLTGYDGVQALDIIGPSDAFTIAEIESDNGQRRPCYEVIIVGITNKPFRAESGVSFQQHTTLGKAPTLDTLISICRYAETCAPAGRQIDMMKISLFMAMALVAVQPPSRRPNAFATCRSRRTN